ncbi:MAG: anti-sigma factor [Alphaproteobacteria bacterium]
MDIADRNLWQLSRATDAVEDECERFLDMAAFADGRLDPDDRERVAEWLRSHPDAASDVAAARMPASAGACEFLPEPAVARASALVGGGGPSRRGTVVAFPVRAGKRPGFATMAQWGGLAAAMIVAGWLGFTLGMDASVMLGRSGPGFDDGVAQELLGSSPAFFRDLTGGA